MIIQKSASFIFDVILLAFLPCFLTKNLIFSLSFHHFYKNQSANFKARIFCTLDIIFCYLFYFKIFCEVVKIFENYTWKKGEYINVTRSQE